MSRRILIYRLGSIGDTVVALPALRLIARAFPDAERRLLTTFPGSGRESPVAGMLAGTGLVHGAIDYRKGERGLAPLMALRKEIRAFRPDALIYLAEKRGLKAAWRDVAFFHACGVPKVIGAPVTRARQTYRYDPVTERFEPEAARLARCLESLGDARLQDPASWDLALTDEERAEARAALAGWPGAGRFVAACVGSKIPVKDWEEANWTRALGRIGREHPGLGLVFVGAPDDAERSARVAEAWPGPSLDLCGRLSPRASAAVMAGADLFLGNDGGPMHLAAAVGTPTAVVFAARNLPGVWFPQGPDHTVLYHRTPCFGCQLDTCPDYDKMCIRAITPDRLADAARQRLSPAARRRDSA
ncbi:MAG: glycosyltransferase family 9 protein [Azospirillaceae bacterium]